MLRVSIVALVLACVACLGSPKGGGVAVFPDASQAGDADASGPLEAAADAPAAIDAEPAPSCAPGSPGAVACERAYYVGLHCCWDARGFSRDFDQWDERALNPQRMCERLAARGIDPAGHCARWAALFNEQSDDDDGGTCPRFDSYLTTGGLVLGMPVCCCNAGESCVARDAGAPLACVP